MAQDAVLQETKKRCSKKDPKEKSADVRSGRIPHPSLLSLRTSLSSILAYAHREHTTSSANKRFPSSATVPLRHLVE